MQLEPELMRHEDYLWAWPKAHSDEPVRDLPRGSLLSGPHVDVYLDLTGLR